MERLMSLRADEITRDFSETSICYFHGLEPRAEDLPPGAGSRVDGFQLAVARRKRLRAEKVDFHAVHMNV